MHPALNIMVKAARRASQIINRASQDIEHLKITTKQQSDFVTEVDKAAEAAIDKSASQPAETAIAEAAAQLAQAKRAQAQQADQAAPTTPTTLTIPP